MHMKSKKIYEFPSLEEILISVEMGFAMSSGGSTEGLSPEQGEWDKATTSSWDY